MRKKIRNNPRVKIVYALIGSTSFAIIAGVLFYSVDPITFRLLVFMPVRQIIYFQSELRALTNWDKIEKFTVPPSKKINIPPDNVSKLKIVADIRIPRGKASTPAILILHGSSPWGRKNGLTLLLSYTFYKAGWIVLAPDARGFGESEDPDTIYSVKSWEVKGDIKRCIKYLATFPRTDPNRIYVLGHSLGSGHALEGALEDPRVKSLILIGPPRFFGGYKSYLKRWNRVRFSADRELKENISENILKDRILKSDISLYAKGPLKKNGHKPILIIDGDFEGNANLNFLRMVLKEIAPPIEHITLHNTGHYCGVINFNGSNTIYYRSDLFNLFYKHIMDYISRIG